VQDLTSQRRAEEQVRQAQKMEALGRLAGGVAHDFNNMLMIILGFSDFLLGALDRADPRWADADEIRKAAERASTLTRQLLAFGQRQVLPTQTLDLNEVIHDMERMLRPLGGERVKLVTSLSSALGGIAADRGRIEQVVMNLALNARDAMPEGGRLLVETMNVSFPEGYAYRTVGIDMPAGDYVLLAVSDTGVGMDAETRSRIFEPFFTTKTGGQNSGLGLATVYGIVTQFEGYLWVDSAPGHGTTFKICFPRIARAEEAQQVAAERSVPRGGGELVLVVEDEEAVRTLACRVLSEQGYRVRQASNGREALELLAAASEPVALVLTDVVMPEMGGQELGVEVARRHPGTRLLYMSGYTDNEVLRRGFDRAGSTFLQKPFSPDSLAHKVREVLDGVPEAV
jgi:nitrogen-specific signal transduction histidine kinase/ActR/RegA family two-component response regulator